MTRTLAPLALGLAASLVALPALAQTQPPTAATADGVTLGGPQIPGVCFLSQQAVFLNAKVGLAATARLQQLHQQTETEIGGLNSPIEAEAKALDAKRATLAPAVFQQKQQALAARYQRLRDLAAQRDREIEATRVKALNQIGAWERPAIADAYKAHACGLLLDRGTVLGGNMAGDLTAAVVQGLDARVTTITFDREILPPQTQPAQ
jgi:Skp family chaperone for outer membrane proteins